MELASSDLYIAFSYVSRVLNVMSSSGGHTHIIFHIWKSLIGFSFLIIKDFMWFEHKQVWSSNNVLLSNDSLCIFTFSSWIVH